MYASYRNRKNLTGGDIEKGSGLHKRPVWSSNWTEKLKQLGISEEALKTVGGPTGLLKTSEGKKLIDEVSGYYFKPTTGTEGTDITGTIPLEFGGRTYQVGKEGIKIINEKVLDEIVQESIEREEYINDVTDLFLHVGDMGVLAVSKKLHDELESSGCLPSKIRTTTNRDTFGVLILAMKIVIDKHIDTIVIPESSLEKLKHYRSRMHKSGVDAMQLKTGE